MISFICKKILIKSTISAPLPAAFLVLALLLGRADEVRADGPYWHVSTFNAANLDTVTGNQAMWSGVPSGTPGYMTAPGYGNDWDDRLYWRTVVSDTSLPTQVHLRFLYNYDTEPGLDFFNVEYEDAGTLVTLAQVSGSNKETSGEFVTPAVFDQTWIIDPGHYSGPNGDQIVLRLRVTSDSYGSDEDGYFESSGAVQVDSVLIELNGSPVSFADFETTGGDGGWTPYDRQAVAEYVRDQILGGSYGDFTLWMTDGPVDSTHVVRDVDPQVPDEQIPYPLAWVVMIDSIPEANWAHPCSWVVIRADLTAHAGPVGKEWHPSVWANMGAGPKVPFGCADVTPKLCECEVEPPVDVEEPIFQHSCLHAVLISGGWNDDDNKERYSTNLTSVYRKLREIGFEKANIFVYYAEGSPLDLDNLDGDNDHTTGSDVTGSTNKTAIRAKISSLCDELNGLRDVLFIYGSNHGNVYGLTLWDFNGNEDQEPEEYYAPEELGEDTQFCRVCRLFITMDQCKSGFFTSIANDGAHDNSAVYTAAASNQYSQSRDYMDHWEDVDLSVTTMNAIHEYVAEALSHLSPTSTPQMAEGSEGNGDVVLNSCCGDETCHVPLYTPFCLGQDNVIVDVDICNHLPEDHTYDLSFQEEFSLPAMWCTIDGPSSFTVLDPTPVLVPAGDYSTVRVRIARPEGMTEELDIGCYTVIVTNVETTNSFRCHGSLWDRRDICAHLIYMEAALLMSGGEPSDVYYIVPGEPYEVNCRLYNTGSTLADLDYQFEVIRSDMSGYPNNIVRLNGMQPGIPVTGTVPMPSVGDSIDIPVTVQFDLLDEHAFYELVFSADTDNSGPKPVTSMGLRSIPSPVSAELVGFRSRWDNGNVVITWFLNGTYGVPTFEVFRRSDPEGSYLEIPDAEVTRNGNQFVFHDESAEPGNSYTYRINIIENGRLLTFFETSISTPPWKLALSQNYPNPFNPMTTILFTLPEKTYVNVSIFTVDGKFIGVLIDKTLEGGLREITWDGKDAKGNRVSSGIYFYRLRAGRETLTKKLVLLN